MLTESEFAQKIKAKYPEYAKVPDAILVQKVVQKYPAYKDQVQTSFVGKLTEATKDVSPEITSKGAVVAQAAQDLNEQAPVKAEIKEELVQRTNPLGAIGQDLIKTAGQGLKDVGQGLYTQAKEAIGVDENKAVSGEGFTQAVQGGLSTVFSPITAVLQNVPGGEKVAEILSKPREWVGDAYESAVTKAGYDPSSPEFQQAKEQLMSAFDVGTLVLPQTKVGKAAIDATKTAVGTGLKTAGIGAKNITMEAFSKATGLKPETIKTIADAPDKVKAVQDLGLEMSKNNVFTTVKEAIDAKKTELSETGSQYKPIREVAAPVKLPDTFWSELLESQGLKYDGTNLIATSESKVRAPADLTALKNAISPYFNKTELTPNEFLNLRQDLSNAAKFETGKTTAATTTSKQWRSDLNELRDQIPGLKELDAKFADQIQYLDEVQDLIYDNTGSLKPNALNSVNNLLGKGKEGKLAYVEEIAPEIVADIKAIKALENVEASQGKTFADLLRGGAGVYAVSSLNLPAALYYVLTSPKIATALIKTYGKAKAKLSSSQVSVLASQIENGVSLNGKSSSLVSQILQNITDQELAAFITGAAISEDDSQQ